MRKLLLGTAAALAFVGAGFVGQAHAQSGCVWTGYMWSCGPTYYYTPGYTGYEGYGMRAGNDGSYPYVTGYKPAWFPSYPGPRPSSGSGH